eukprot:scaffold18557_cov25-Cyclotella_meneghiniana.AAC.2
MMSHCASCGKADAKLKACKACKLLFALPKKREDCPICMLMLPCRDDETAYCLTRNCCPFCNAVDSDQEIINRLTERMEKYNDPEAMDVLGGCYNEGLRGLPVDKPKPFGLFRCASELGCAGGHYNLASAYELGNGTEVDRKKAVHHFQIAAMMGNMLARHNLGATEANNGNKQRAMKHFMIAAESGLEVSLDTVIECYSQGYLTKEDFEKTLRGYHASCVETKSDQRDRAAVIIARDEK